MAPSERDVAAWSAHLGAPADPAALRTELTTGTVPEVAAAVDPARPALCFPDESDRWITHGELTERAARTSGWLAARGLRPGDRVVLCGRNTLNLVLAYLAILRAGGVVVLANPAYTRDELAYLVTDSGARWALTSSAELAGLVEHAVSLDEPLPEADPVPPAPADPAMLAYTSGTTGRPKGVPLTHANLLASIRGAMGAWRWRADDVLVHALPLSHQHGLGGVHATLIAGSAAVVFAEFDPDRLLARARTGTVLFAVPAVYQRLVDHPGLGELNLRLAVSGSAPLDAALSDRLAAVLGTRPLERYGSTEGGLNISNLFDGPRVPGAVGIPLPGTELRIADPSGQPLADGDEGEILVRGPAVFGGYFHRAADTAAAFHGDWFRTGDLGVVGKDDGYLRITGRIKELIITGGMNVYPREVELALEAHPAVREAAVAGLPSARWGEEVTAWVVPAAEFDTAELDTAELIAHCKQRLAGYKCPKRVLIANTLPRNSMGKLTRRALVTADEPLETTALDAAVRKIWRPEL